MKRLEQQGFTLVELAIVLVIIGLIVSSVLVGQDLIKSAELRATTTQYNQFQAGVNTFLGKYNALPGDVSTDFGLGAGQGDGDGKIENSTGNGTAGTITTNVQDFAPASDGESTDFWAHLTASGKEMIPGGYDGGNTAEITVNIPQMKFGGAGWMAMYYDHDRHDDNATAATASNDQLNKHYFATGLVSALTNALTIEYSFVPLDAFGIDDKIDDGVPNSGAVQSVLAGASPDESGSTNAGASTAHCENSTPTPDEYQFTATTKNCALIFEMATF